jgi:hypothetical protein
VRARLEIHSKNTRDLTPGANAAALASVLVAGTALAWTVYRDIAQRRALGRERRERKAGDALEETRRAEEITVLRRELTVAEGRGRASRDAHLVAVTVGGSSGSNSGVDFPLSLRNVGGAPAEDVMVWLALDEAGIGPKDARTLTERHRFDVVPPGVPALSFSLNQAGPFYGPRIERTGLIVAEWRDGNGDHLDKIGRLTVFE